MSYWISLYNGLFLHYKSLSLNLKGASQLPVDSPNSFQDNRIRFLSFYLRLLALRMLKGAEYHLELMIFLTKTACEPIFLIGRGWGNE